MSIASPPDLARSCADIARRARAAAEQLATLTGAQKNGWLRQSAALLRSSHESILAANALDLAAAPGFGLTDAAIDRLRLTPARIASIAAGLDEVAALPDPVGEVMEGSVRPNGLSVSKIRVPLGVVFFIYESRPNVTADAAAICVKSGNAVILRGGKEAAHSSRAIVTLLQAAAGEFAIPADALHLVETADREAVKHFLHLSGEIDVAIPRGGEGLIRLVADEARMPVIKHFTGNCHVYIDRAADLAMAETITLNAKCQRMGVCNACESLLVHADVAGSILPSLGAKLQAQGVEIRGDESVCRLVAESVPATDLDYDTEYLGPVISVRVVPSLEEAIRHINRHGSKHTDAIVTADLQAARTFVQRVDSSAVMVNASTRFNDGFELGLGAEIGISTDKFHARGPCGLRELTTYKWVVHGEGHIRG
jgi:glutamate-5-semialdehyde dehydrogenase